MYLTFIEWLAFALGTAGTIIWASNWRGGYWASVFWLVSGILWIVFGYLNGHNGLIGKELIGIGLYVYAIYQWRVGKAREKKAEALDKCTPGV